MSRILRNESAINNCAVRLQAVKRNISLAYSMLPRMQSISFLLNSTGVCKRYHTIINNNLVSETNRMLSTFHTLNDLPSPEDKLVFKFPTVVYSGAIDYTGDLECGDKSYWELNMLKDEANDLMILSNPLANPIKTTERLIYTREESYINELKVLVSATTIADAELRKVVSKMVDHFLDGTGTDFSDKILTEKVAEHSEIKKIYKRLYHTIRAKIKRE